MTEETHKDSEDAIVSSIILNEMLDAEDDQRRNAEELAAQEMLTRSSTRPFRPDKGKEKICEEDET